MVGMPPCCARDARGHAAAALPSSLMTSRRFTAPCIPCTGPKVAYPCRTAGFQFGLCPFRVIRDLRGGSSTTVYVRLAPESGQEENVSLSPLCANRRHMHRSKQNHLFDHLVGAQLEFADDGEAERLRCLEIDGELELGRLLDGKIARLRALENFVHVACGATKQVRQVGPVGGKPARRDELGFRIDGRQLARERERSHPVAIAE